MQLVRILVLLAALCCATAAAQRTWTVDANGGGQFTTVEPAILAASPGDLILVRAGRYPGFLIDRGVTVVSQGATLFQTLHNPVIAVRDVPAGQRVVVKGFFSSSLPMIFGASNTQAQVVFEDMYGEGNVIRAPNVTFRRCTLISGFGLRVTDGGAVVTQCTLMGQAPLTVTRSNVVFAESTATTAGSGFGQAAVRLDGGSVTITGGSDTVLIPDTTGVSMPVVDVLSTGDVFLSPYVTMLPHGGAPVVRGGRVTIVSVPSLRADVLGATLSTRLHAPGTGATATLLALPVRNPAPTPFGALWLPLDALVVDVGVVDAAGVRNLTLPILPVALGSLFAMQSVAVTSGQLQLSTPLLFVLP